MFTELIQVVITVAASSAHLPQTAVAQQPAVRIVQKTSQWCSPAIANVVGNVYITCIGVDPRALKRLNEELAKKNLQLSEMIRAADDWAARYKVLDARLAEAHDNTALSLEAEEYLHEGELDKAGALLDQILPKEDQEVTQASAALEKAKHVAAGDHYNRGLTYELQFRLADALPQLEKAYQYQPEDFGYALEYADALTAAEKFQLAESVLTDVRDRSKQTAGKEPDTVQPVLSEALGNLALIYTITNRKADADKAYQEDLPIARDLAQKNPEIYDPMLASALSNYAELCSHLEKLKDAETYYNDAAERFSQLAKVKPTIFQPYVAAVLSNMAILYSRTHRLQDAERALNDASGILRDLTKTNPEAYRPQLLSTLVNLASLYSSDQSGKSETIFVEALGIVRPLIKVDSQTYTPTLAVIQGNLALLHLRQGNFRDAQVETDEVLPIDRHLSTLNPSVYGDLFARDLLVAAELAQANGGDLSKSCPLLVEALAAAINQGMKHLIETHMTSCARKQ